MNVEWSVRTSLVVLVAILVGVGCAGGERSGAEGDEQNLTQADPSAPYINRIECLCTTSDCKTADAENVQLHFFSRTNELQLRQFRGERLQDDLIGQSVATTATSTSFAGFVTIDALTRKEITPDFPTSFVGATVEVDERLLRNGVRFEGGDDGEGNVRIVRRQATTFEYSACRISVRATDTN